MRRLLLRKRERIAIVRRRLNEGSVALIVAGDAKELQWFMRGCIDVLDGDEEALAAEERKLVRKLRSDWLRLRR